MEAPRLALGQASPEGFDRSPDVIYQLRAATDQRLARADQGHMRLALFAPMLDGYRSFGSTLARRARSGVDLIGLALALSR